MMRHLLCAPCGLRATGERAPANATRITPANEDGPAEFERFIWGRAKHPTKAQRQIRVNGTALPLPLDAYSCDSCGGSISPGETACAHSAIDAGRTIGPWESEYLDGGLKPALRPYRPSDGDRDDVR